MLKRLFLFACLSSSAFCFERGAELFEKKDYLESAQTFLIEAKKNDVRVPFYVRFLSENALINPQDLGEALEQEWHERLQDAAFAPIVLGRGAAYLQISLLVQGLCNVAVKKAELTLRRIKNISSEHRIGYGYYVIGRFLEKQSKINRMLANQIVGAYEKGAEFAHGLSILSLVDLPSKYPNLFSKLKIEPMYLGESKVLSDPQVSIWEREKILSRFYNQTVTNSYGIFLKSGARKGFWQFEGARQGDTDLQLMLSTDENNRGLQKHLSIHSIQDDEADRWLYFSALGGEPQAQVNLGKYFLFGNHTLFPENKPRALLLFESAILTFTQNQKIEAKDFLKYCLLNAGSLLDKGEYVPQNNEKAFEYFQLAANLFKDPIATFNVGSMLEQGRGVPQDEETARTYFEKASHLGYSEAAWLIGHRHLWGVYGYAKDPKIALDYLNIAASKDNPKALHDLGCIYGRHLKNVEVEDYPVLQDKAKALGFLKRSAEAGHDKAQRLWANCVIDKSDQLPEKEAKLLVECLERQYLEFPLMKAWLGMFLRTGYRDIVAYDGERALKLLTEAANEGQKCASFVLGAIYEKGECGVEKNYDTARAYYESSQEIPASVTNLGWFYEMGYGSLVKDGNKAIEYYQQALKMGDGVAANNLGALYQKGKFVKNDDTQAFFYYQRGHELGDPDASYQYSLYLCQGLCCEENVQEAREILLKLDPSSPDVAYTLAVIQWREGLTDSPLIFQRLAEEGMPLAQYAYGLLLYLTHLGAETNSQNMLKESGRFIRLAAQNGFQHASSALRLLIERSLIEKEEAMLIVKKLLEMDIEGARAVKQSCAQGRLDEKEQECQAETSLKQTAEALAERDPEIARKRQEQYLAHFMDPLNRKNVSVKGLYKIAASQASQQGGGIEPARGGGSGIKIKVGDNVTGFHNMHRSGQSSNATLDPGRANSLRNFVEDITQ